MPDTQLTNTHQTNTHQTGTQLPVGQHRSEQSQREQPHSGDLPDPALDDAPFLVEHRQEDRTPSGYFRPASRLVLTSALRTGGLWAALPPEDFRNLLLMLTFLTPNGWCRPTLLELAEAMRVSQAKARNRMQRLTGTQWRGQPLVAEMPRPDGLAAFVPGRALVAHEDVPPPEPPLPPLPQTAGRETVIAHSRARYARTRAEVEAQIGQMMGWGPPAFSGDDPAVAEGKRQAFSAMTNLGMPKEQALDLLTRFPLEAVERQIAWLPDRNAKNPARFLAAAIEGDYEMPPGLRRRALLAAALQEQDKREQEEREQDKHEQEEREQAQAAAVGQGETPPAMPTPEAPAKTLPDGEA